MKPKKDKKVKIVTQRNKHIIMGVYALLMGLLILSLDDWSIWIDILTAACCLVNKFEPEDELYKENLNKSNTVIMWFMMAAVIILGMYSRAPFRLSEEVYFSIPCFALSLRSFMFLWFDRTPKNFSEE